MLFLRKKQSYFGEIDSSVLYILNNAKLKGNCVLAFFESTVNVKLRWDVVTGAQVACATPNVRMLSAGLGEKTMVRGLDYVYRRL